MCNLIQHGWIYKRLKEREIERRGGEKGESADEWTQPYTHTYTPIYIHILHWSIFHVKICFVNLF